MHGSYVRKIATGELDLYYRLGKTVIRCRSRYLNAAIDNALTLKLTPEEFEGFFTVYEKACYEEGVIPLKVHVGYNEGCASCLNLAPDAEAVKRAHDRVGLPYDTITEVKAATPGDTFFKCR